MTDRPTKRPRDRRTQESYTSNKNIYLLDLSIKIKTSLSPFLDFSRLLSPGKDECGGQVGFDEEPVDVHIPTR